MQPRRKLLTLAIFIAFASSAFAQFRESIQITGPVGPISRGSWAFVTVAGVTEDELAKSQVGLQPVDDRIMTVRMPSVGSVMYIVLVSPDALPGTRQFVVSLNPWRKPLDEAITLAATSGMAPADSAELVALSERFSKAYPYRFGSAVLEVAGSIPFPPDPDPPKPDPPDPITDLKFPVWTIVIRRANEISADQAETLLTLRSWSDQQPADKVAHVEFSPDAIGPGGSADDKVASYVAKIPSTAKLPYVFIMQAKTAGGSHIHWQGELPSKSGEIIERIVPIVR